MTKTMRAISAIAELLFATASLRLRLNHINHAVCIVGIRNAQRVLNSKNAASELPECELRLTVFTYHITPVGFFFRSAA